MSTKDADSYLETHKITAINKTFMTMSRFSPPMRLHNRLNTWAMGCKERGTGNSESEPTPHVLMIMLCTIQIPFIKVYRRRVMQAGVT